MKVFINTKIFEAPAEADVAMLLDCAGIKASQGIAVAVNEVVIAKSEWTEKKINENDKILIIRASQGG